MRKSVAAKSLMILFVGFLCCQAGLAQTEKGDSELQLQGFGFFTIGQDDDLRSIIFVANYGYFFTDRQELGAGTSITFFDSESDDSETTVGLQFFYRYNFAEANRKTMPYVSVDVSSFDVSDSDFWGARPGVGVKAFINEYTAFDINGGYNFLFSEPSDGVFDVRFGISFLF